MLSACIFLALGTFPTRLAKLNVLEERVRSCHFACNDWNLMCLINVCYSRNLQDALY